MIACFINLSVNGDYDFLKKIYLQIYNYFANEKKKFNNWQLNNRLYSVLFHSMSDREREGIKRVILKT